MVKRWKATEKEICRLLGKKHVAVPADLTGEVVEMKAQHHKLNMWQMCEILRKPWTCGKPLIVATTSGFTPGAREVVGRRRSVWMFKYRPGKSSRKINR